MLTEISWGNDVYCAHSMPATIIPKHLEDGTYLEITFMKYHQYCLWMLAVNAQNTLFRLLFVKLSEKAHYTVKLPQHV